jgi:uncharacterized cupin superfamily protein
MLTFNVFDATFEYDASDPEPFRGGQNQFGPKLGATQLGATIYELPPGQSVCPYHYESKEEWLIVLQGQLTVRHPHGESVLSPGDVTAFPAGPAGAHRTTNHTTEPVRLLMFADANPVGYSCYPDSNKITHWTDSPDPDDNVRVRRGRNLDYWDGELG